MFLPKFQIGNWVTIYSQLRPEYNSNTPYQIINVLFPNEEWEYLHQRAKMQGAVVKLSKDHTGNVPYFYQLNGFNYNVNVNSEDLDWYMDTVGESALRLAKAPTLYHFDLVDLLNY